MPMELVFVIGMAVLLILCIKVKANAFISLLATALVMGMLSGMSGADTVSAITRSVKYFYTCPQSYLSIR